MIQKLTLVAAILFGIVAIVQPEKSVNINSCEPGSIATKCRK